MQYKKCLLALSSSLRLSGSYGGPGGRATRRCLCDDGDATIDDDDASINDDDATIDEDDATIDDGDAKIDDDDATTDDGDATIDDGDAIVYQLSTELDSLWNAGLERRASV